MATNELMGGLGFPTLGPVSSYSSSGPDLG